MTSPKRWLPYFCDYLFVAVVSLLCKHTYTTSTTTHLLDYDITGCWPLLDDINTMTHACPGNALNYWFRPVIQWVEKRWSNSLISNTIIDIMTLISSLRWGVYREDIPKSPFWARIRDVDPESLSRGILERGHWYDISLYINPARAWYCLLWNCALNV